MKVNTIYGLGILLSSSLETYNYMLFPFVQGLIMPSFYHGENNIGFLILLLAALFRPLGSLFFGYIGDTYSRKTALLLSMSLMAFACLIIVFSPKHKTIGNYAIISLIIARILQVISISGEHAGVAISLIESWKSSSTDVFQKYGLASGLVYLFSMFGTFLVTFVECRINIFNWRYAYFLSFILVIFCFFLRSLPYVEEKYSSEVQENDSCFWRNFLACLLISAAMSSLYYFNTVFIKSFFQFKQIGFAKEFSELYLFIYMFATLFFGFISDFFKKLYLFIVIPGVFLFINLSLTLWFCNPVLHCLNIVFLAMYAGPSHAYFFKLFSNKNRYKGVSIAYSLGTALIGSSTPYVAIYLMHNFVLIVLYLLFLISLSLFGVCLSYRSLQNY
ncbi:MFS transporter [Alphaproteobacteria bacterium endosymbiont of Tiliacea citrago]|uniref:MFS transporter n=1 Tax=Alphaproteobacteria bacterium endosymbiont of Tiliacea citrago TaxID=3077944 RepID=UPI00313B38DF